MIKNSYRLFKDSNFWKDQWEEKVEGYLKGKPVLGALIENLVENNTLSGVRTICEIAAGSARDSIYLGKRFIVTATDKYISQFSISEKFAERYKSNITFQEEDAYNFTFADNHFDLVFHNGFFILFPDNQDIVRLITEQMRITKKYAMIVVHNKWDFYSRLWVRHLANKGDLLYDFRWWSLRELKRLIKPYGKIISAGGLENRIIRSIQTYKFTPSFIKRMKLWELGVWKKLFPCERIYLVVRKTY